jgi:hypothetical protein
MSDTNYDDDDDENDDEDSELEYEHVTTKAIVDTYDSSGAIFESLLREVRELSRKKPEATMSGGKVKIINRVLEDLLGFLKDEPTGKYLEALDNEALPQMSDALLIMVQFETALEGFKERYYGYFSPSETQEWITKELLDEFSTNEDEAQEE